MVGSGDGLSTFRRLSMVGRARCCHDLTVRNRYVAYGVLACTLTACTTSKSGPSPAPTTTERDRTSVTNSTPSAPRTGPLTTGPNVRPGEKPPVFPALAKQHTELGASLFGAYYFRALDWAIATNDDSPVRRIAASTCNSCQKVYDELRLLHSRHEIETGGRIQIRGGEIEDARYRLDYDVALRVSYSEEAVVLVNRDGVSRTTSPAVQTADGLVFVKWLNGSWRVVEVTVS